MFVWGECVCVGGGGRACSKKCTCIGSFVIQLPGMSPPCRPTQIHRHIMLLTVSLAVCTWPAVCHEDTTTLQPTCANSLSLTLHTSPIPLPHSRHLHTHTDTQTRRCTPPKKHPLPAPYTHLCLQAINEGAYLWLALEEGQSARTRLLAQRQRSRRTAAPTDLWVVGTAATAHRHRHSHRQVGRQQRT